MYNKRTAITMSILMFMAGFATAGATVADLSTSALTVIVVSFHLIAGFVVFLQPQINSNSRVKKTTLLAAVICSPLGIGSIILGQYFYKRYSVSC